MAILAFPYCCWNMRWIRVTNVGFQLTLGSWMQAMLARVSSKAWAVALHCNRLLLVDIVFAFLDITVKSLWRSWGGRSPQWGLFLLHWMACCWLYLCFCGHMPVWFPFVCGRFVWFGLGASFMCVCHACISRLQRSFLV